MPISDEVLLQMMFKQHEGQPIEFIMAEYGKAKQLYLQIEQGIAQGTNGETIEVKATQVKKELPAKEDDKKGAKIEIKHYTRDDLVCDPKDAIKEDGITCCICGETHHVLNARHFKRDKTNAEAYRAVCGYAKDQLLMSGQAARAYIERGKNMGKARAEKLAAKAEQETAAAE